MPNVRPASWPEFDLLVKIYKTVPNKPGAYIIATGSPIHRLYGIDQEGIIDIGESANLYDRISSFIGCARKTRKAGHMAGWRYAEYNFNNVIPLDKLVISWKTTPSKNHAYRLEAALLRMYFSTHFELPPLNYKFNWEED